MRMWDQQLDGGGASAEAHAADQHAYGVGIPVRGVGAPDALRLPSPTDESVIELIEAARAMGPDPALADLDDERVEIEVRTLASQIAATTCRWLVFVAELVVRDIWSAQGARTPAAWLSWAVGMGSSTAREHVRVALRLRELPVIREAFAAGTISYSKVRAITRVAVPELQEKLLEWAECAPASELERVVRGCVRSDRLHHADPERTRGLSTRVEGGEMILTLRLPVAAGEAVLERIDRHERATRQQRTAEPSSGAGDDPSLVTVDSPVAARRADAAVELLVGGTEVGETVEPLLVLHVSPEDLTASAEAVEPRSRRVEVTVNARPVPAMSAATLRRLACDVDVAVLVEASDGTPLDLGRRQRRLSRRLRRALVARDRGCRFPGCGTTHGVHAHHIVHWADDGPTDLDNLVLLCSYHHRWVHEHGWRIELDGQRARVVDRTGVPLPSALASGPASAEALERHLRDARRRSGLELQPDWDGRSDTDMATAIDFVTRELDRYREAPVAAAA